MKTISGHNNLLRKTGQADTTKKYLLFLWHATLAASDSTWGTAGHLCQMRRQIINLEAKYNTQVQIL